MESARLAKQSEPMCTTFKDYCNHKTALYGTRYAVMRVKLALVIHREKLNPKDRLIVSFLCSTSETFCTKEYVHDDFETGPVGYQ